MRLARSVTGLAIAASSALVLAASMAPFAAAQDNVQFAAAPEPPAAPAPAPGMSEAVAAIVNDDIISTYDLLQRMRLLMVTSGVQPTEETVQQIQREALRSLVDERLQFQELRRVEREQKIEIIANQKDIDEEIAEIAKGNNMSGPQLLQALAAQGVGAETLRSQIRSEVSWQRWIQGRYGSRLRVGEDQIKAVQERMELAASKPQYQIGEIFLDAARIGGMDQAVKGASELIDQMQKGAPFPAVARQFSGSSTAAKGGDAGWISPGEMPPEVDAVLEQLRPGQLSPPIPVKDGVYIVYLREKRSGAAATLVSLKQAAVPLAGDATPEQIETARVKLESIRPAATSCETIETAAAGVEGVMAGDLGEAEIQDLAPAFRAAAETLQPGQLSAPIRTAAGLHLVAVCGKRQSGVQIPSSQQIENRLFGQQLSMISRRYLRDLRNSATIETR